jgi:hypothetical protein
VTALAALLLAILGLAVVCSAPHDVPFSGTGAFRPGGAYTGTDVHDVRSVAYGTWSGDDANRGRARSVPFRAGPIFSLKVAGGTSRPDETIELVRADGATLTLRDATDAGERYAARYVVLPPSWWFQRVRVVVTDDGSGTRGWIGVADAGAPALGELLAMPQFQLPWLVLLESVVLGAPALVAGAGLARRLGFGEDWAPFCCGMLVLGAAGETAFFAARFTPLAWTAGLAVEAFLLAAAAAALRAREETATSAGPARARLPHAAAWGPLAVATAAALFYAVLLGAATPLGGNVFTASHTSFVPLPGDDVLPQLLARQAETHAPPRPFFGDWLSSDRPPLQAGIVVVSDAVLRFVVGDLRYEVSAQWLQALVFGGLYALARAAGASARRALIATALCVPVGFFLINTVFTWPKLLSAAFGLAAIALALRPHTRGALRYAPSAAALAFGALAHGGVVFTVPALIGALLVRDRANALRPLVAGAVVCAVLVAPWVAYQRLYDPPGDRLVKWHLAGQIQPVPDRSAIEVVIAAYGRTPPGDIVGMRLRNLAEVVHTDYGRRSGEFLFVLTALGLFAVPLVLAFVPPLREPAVAALALIAVVSVIVWCAVMWADTTVHVGSYLTMALLYLTGALVVARRPAVALAFAAAQTIAFAAVWLAGTVQLAVAAAELAFLALGTGAAYASVRLVQRAAARKPAASLRRQTP